MSQEKKKKSSKKRTKSVQRVKAEVVEPKTLTLEQIEAEMVKIACDDTNDIVKSMINEKRISMLEKVFNTKLKMIQLKTMEQPAITGTEPITVKFISSKTEAQQARLERIDKEIKEQGIVREDA